MANFPRPDLPPSSDASPRCRNCGAIVSAHFCPECGQSVKDRNRSIWSFARDTLSNFFATDSRALRTLTLLIFRPGVLTQENLRGRWQSYVPPFRLYLFLSLLSLFVLMGPFSNMEQIEKELGQSLTFENTDSGPNFIFKDTKDEDSKDAGKDPPAEEEVEQPANDSETEGIPESEPETKIETETDEGFFDTIGRYFMEQGERLNEMPRDQLASTFVREAVSAFPTFLILIIPLFALGMKILYLGSGRYLFEHLLFSSHFNSLALLVIAISSLVPSATVFLLLYLGYLPAYMAISMRRVYGSSAVGIFFRLPLILIMMFFISLSLIVSVAIYAFFQA